MAQAAGRFHHCVPGSFNRSAGATIAIVRIAILIPSGRIAALFPAPVLLFNSQRLPGNIHLPAAFGKACHAPCVGALRLFAAAPARAMDARFDLCEHTEQIRRHIPEEPMQRRKFLASSLAASALAVAKPGSYLGAAEDGAQK